MALTIGIVGLPNVGKSTLFNALTRAGVLAANYPFATIEPNVGVVPLPDPRLSRLAEIFGSERILPATVSFVDIAGIVKGASEGEGLGNKFLANIREADAICQVTRAFQDDNVVHVEGRVDPRGDIETVNTELILADLQTMERVIPRLEREARTNKENQAALDNAHRVVEVLNAGNTLFAAGAAAGVDMDLARELQLLTTKPFIYVFNVDEGSLADDALRSELQTLVAPAEAIILDAKFEMELTDLGGGAAGDVGAAAGIAGPGPDRRARVGSAPLALETSLPAGPKEARAWTIHTGWTAPQAAGVIHTDFQKGFIKAEVVSFEDLDTLGGMAEAKAKGRLRLEGKDYVMADGDVVEFRFNV